MFVHITYLGIQAILTKEPGTEKCEHRDDIASANSKNK